MFSIICTVSEKHSWSGLVKTGQILTITDTHGQQVVDFLCYDADNKEDRYSAANTIKLQGNIYVGEGTILYSDSRKALVTVIKDSIGRHDPVYGCCSNPNNMLRYGVVTTESCYDNFTHELTRHGMGVEAIVPNINWFMSVPVLDDGSAGVSAVELKPGIYVRLRAVQRSGCIVKLPSDA